MSNKFYDRIFLSSFRRRIFENPEAGASQDAIKVLVLITDGDPSDSDRRNITAVYKEKNIIRFVIAVRCDVSSILSDTVSAHQCNHVRFPTKGIILRWHIVSQVGHVLATISTEVTSND